MLTVVNCCLKVVNNFLNKYFLKFTFSPHTKKIITFLIFYIEFIVIFFCSNINRLSYDVSLFCSFNKETTIASEFQE